jgi:hypothetical protein
MKKVQIIPFGVLFICASLVFINVHGQGIVLNNAKIGNVLPLPVEAAGTMEGSLGEREVRIKLVSKGVSADGQFCFLGGEMNVYALENFTTESNGHLKLIFYQSYPGIEGALEHKFILDGVFSKDGRYSGTYKEVPANREGKFSVKMGPVETISGNYFSSDNWLFLQLSDKGVVNFSIGDDWCGVDGQAMISAKKAHYEKMMSGVKFYINFDFSKAGVCEVESNSDSPEAQEQGIGSQMGNVMRCKPKFTGTYILKTNDQIEQEAREQAAARATAPTPTAEPVDSENNVDCDGMTDAQKSKRLDKAKGVTMTSKAPDSVVFVFTQKPGPTDHGATGGHCGVRLDTYKKTKAGGLVHTGRWEDLNAGFDGRFVVGEAAPVSPRYLLLEIETDADDGMNSDYVRYVFDGSAKIIGQDTYRGWDRDVWVRKDGKDLLWDITVEHIAVKTPDMKNLWINKEEIHQAVSKFSPNLQYASRQLGKNGEMMVIYGLDGKYAKKFKIPFSMTASDDGEVLGLTDVPEVIFRNKLNIYRIDVNGTPELVAVLPEYPNRKLGMHFGEEDPSDSTRLFEYEATTDKIKNYPQPAVKLNLLTLEGNESLDGGKWKPIDLKVKKPSAQK